MPTDYQRGYEKGYRAGRKSTAGKSPLRKIVEGEAGKKSPVRKIVEKQAKSM